MKTIWTTLFLIVACASALAPPEVFAQSERNKKGEPVAPKTGRAGKSPMPPGRPEPDPEGMGLIRLKWNAYDAALAEMCRRYAQGDAPTRATMRRSIPADDLNILAGFAEVAAVFGLRRRSAETLTDGLTALAMIEVARMEDDRALITSLALLHHCIRRIGASPEKLFRDAAALADRKTAQFILQYLKRPEVIKELHQATGLDEVETEEGVGFISWDYGEYDPTYDLKKVAIEVADLFAAEKYLASPAVATDFPGVWLETNNNAARDRALAKARGGVSVHGHLVSGNRITQTLMVFIVELEDESSARALLDVARRKRPRDIESTLALAEGRIFCLLVLQEVGEGVKSRETNESIQRYSGRLAAIFRRHVKD